MSSAFSDLEKFPVKKFISENLTHLILFFLASIAFYKFMKSSKKLPPGPIGLPLVGYRPFLGGHPHKTIVQLSKKYGKLISLRFGPNLVVVANEYKLAKELMSHSMALDRSPAIFQHITENGMAALNGKEWEEQRRFSLQSMRDLGLGRGRFIEMVQDEVQDFMERLKSFKGQPVELTQKLTTTVSNNVLSLLIGRRLDSGTEEDKMQLACRFLDTALNFFGSHTVITRMPMLRKCFEYLKIAGFDKAAKTNEDFSAFIRKEMENHKFQSDYKGVSDFINLYWDKMDSIGSRKEHSFSAENLEGNMLVLFLGGSDTIVTSILWLFRFMAGYPEIQKKVQEELDEHLGRDGKVSYEERFKLPYTMAVLMEAQRFSSIAALPLRRAREEFEIQGYTIPKGCEIMSNMWALHHDPNYWDEPDKFNPDRFLREDKKEVLTKLPSFAPFSFGKRMCPGETVAWIEILNYFTAVMQRFTICPPSGQKVHFEAAESLVIRLKPQPLCFIERTEGH